MLEYMLTLKNGFNGGCNYYKTHTEAVMDAMKLRRCGYIPDEIWEYNEITGKYDRLIGRFTTTTKEA